MSAVWFTGIASLLLFAGFVWYLAPLEPGVLVLQLAFTPRAFGAVIHAWPPEHLARYRAHLPVDCVFLVCYGTFGYLLATRTRLFAAWPPIGRRAAVWALPLAALLDAAENGLHWWLTAAPRFGLAPLYFGSALCATSKWLLILGFAVALLLACARSDD